MRTATLATLATLPLVFCAPSPTAKRWWNEDASSLAAQAVAAGKLYFGDAWQSFYRVEQNFSTILQAQFNQYTFENEMKCECTIGDPDVSIATQAGARSRRWADFQGK